MTDQQAKDSSSAAAMAAPAIRLPGERERALDILIGSWINQGDTVPTDGATGVSILTSDVYQWTAGGYFVLHTAFGQIGQTGVGGTELIGWDEAAGAYRSYFFDSQGGASVHQLTITDGSWTWTDGDSTRCRATFSADGRVQTAHHEASPDGGSTWLPSMAVTLTRVV